MPSMPVLAALGHHPKLSTLEVVTMADQSDEHLALAFGGRDSGNYFGGSVRAEPPQERLSCETW